MHKFLYIHAKGIGQSKGFKETQTGGRQSCLIDLQDGQPVSLSSSIHMSSSAAGRADAGV